MSRCLRWLVVALVWGLVCVSMFSVLVGCGSENGAGDATAGGLLPGQSASPFASPFSAANGEKTGPTTVSSRSTTVAQRDVSRTRFEHLGGAAAARVAREAFPEAIDRPASGLNLPKGARVARYVADNAAQVVLPEGKRSVVESTGPLAVETGGGRLASVDLGIVEKGNAFESARPVVGVVIPARASQGVQLPESGVSLTQVDAAGRPMSGGVGTVDGASVLYANTQRDSDTVVKPTLGGFSADAILRSVDSPDRLYFRLGVPAGATVKQVHTGISPVVVNLDGRALASVLPPVARDAAGASVPVVMTNEGDTLVVSVSASGEHLWPIRVDPEVIDTNTTGNEARLKTNWRAEYSNPSLFSEEPTINEDVVKYSNVGIGSAEWMASTYPTQGESRIFNAEAWVYEQVLHGRSRLQILKSGGEESGTVLAERSSQPWRSASLCAKNGESPCKSTSGSKENVLRYKQEEIEPESYADALYSVFGYAKVYITQEKGPELSFNNTSSLIDEGRTNVMYGAGGWLSPTSGAVEMIAHDPGIGVSRAGAQELSGGNYHTQISIYNENRCKGVQCKETFANEITYSPKMSDGEDRFELWGEDMLGYFGYLGGGGAEVIIKVDGTPPHAIKVSGWNAAHEVSAASHSLTFEATDGEGTTPSSGVAAISVSVDGGSYSGVPIVPCSVSSGPCTSSGKWTLDAEGLSEGVHSLIVTAKDNASNEDSEEFIFDVRHGSPVPAGPGTVDPTTGQFKLTANDVSLAGAGSLSRTFESNNLSAGAEGPFGPQWAASLGDGQGLTVLINGSVVLKSPSGGTTTFWLNEKKEYESPPGDENLKIEAKEEVVGKGITEYLLVETKTGFTTAFKQPTGMGNTTPLYAGQFGGEAGHLSMPGGIVADSSGDLWVADWGNSRVVKFSPQGAVLGVYGSPGPYSGEFLHPRDLTINPSTGNVYVADEGNNRVVELNSKGEFVMTFGWGVSNGKTEYQVCTTYCQSGASGSGNGQFYELKGITVDGSGNVWVTDRGNNRIEEFTSTGAFVQKWGTEGTAEGYLDGPIGLVFSGEHLWVAESLTNRVQEFSTSGSYLGHFGKGGSGNGEFSSPRGITVDAKTGNFYVADGENHRVQEFNSSGSYVTQFGSAGSGSGQFGEPRDVTINTSGNIYVTDWFDNRVAEWTRPTWLPTLSENALKSPSATYSYEAVQVEGRTVIQPTEELAPVPAHVNCGTKPSELKKGCRALTFVYDTGATTAGSGVFPSEWGNYKGRLEKVKLHVWEPSKGEMTEPTVAEYQYDGLGRLRAEWDPRISPALKTTYGYDEEGHVAAVSAPGLEPWLIHYGALSGDLNNGRMLSVTRPAAASVSVLKEQKAMAAPVKSTAPKLSTSTPTVGTTVSVSSEGTWSNSPLAYNYQWYDCTSESAEWKACTAIGGAVNKTYTPQVRDAGYYLLVRVAAQNSTGVTYAGTSASKMIALSRPAFVSPAFGTKGSGAGQMFGPQDDAFDSGGHVWLADAQNNRIDEFSATGTFMEAIGWGVSNGKAEAEICTTTCQIGLAGSGHGQFSLPFGIAINQNTGAIYVGDQGNKRVEELSSTGTFQRAFGMTGTGAGQFADTAGLAIDEFGNVWVADYENHRVQEFSAFGGFIAAFGWGVKDGKEESEVCTINCRAGISGAGTGQFAWPVGVSVANGVVYVADYSDNRVEELTTAGSFIRQFGVKGTGEGQISLPYDVTVEPAGGDIYVSEFGNSRVQIFTASGGYVQYLDKGGTGAGEFTGLTGIAISASHELFAVDNNDARIERWKQEYSTNNPLPEPPVAMSNSTWTFEYHIPTSGGALPNLSESEVSKWDEEDYPVEGMAMFPPVRPMGWPAKEYELETIDYMDARGHTVNVASPTGGISTTEYDEEDNVRRTLSQDNRAVALKEANPAEAAEKLDTQQMYSGGRLVETLGPEHKVKLAVGKEGKRDEEVSAREKVKYYYDEGAPEGKEYGLLTRTVDSALVGSKDEEPRVTRTYYSGQNGLGWTLRKPTSVVTDPAGLDLVHTTVYDEAGNVIETKAPGGTSETVPPPEYHLSFGKEGEGSGQFKRATSVAADASGRVWVNDREDHRIERFSASGAWEASYGTKGAGAGQLEGAWNLAVNQNTGSVYVADSTNNRIDEFGSTGAFVESIGWGVSDGKEALEVCTTSCRAGLAGAGNGQLNYPVGIAVDSKNHIWVTDYKNNRVEEYSEAGAFITGFGSAGNGNGQLNEPGGITVSEGEVYVVDRANHRIEEFSQTGSYLNQFGSQGSGPGQFHEAADIASNPNNGDLYVTDEEEDRIEVYSPAGKFLVEFGEWGPGAGHTQGPEGIAINASGDVYVSEDYGDRVDEWVPPGAGGAHMTYSTAFGSQGSGSEQFHDPVMTAIDGEGNVWVTDFNNARVKKFSAQGKFIASYGSYGSGEGQFEAPTGIAVNQGAGNVYVADCEDNRIEELSSTGSYVRSFGKYGSEPGQLECPQGVKIDASGDVWVADSHNNRIEEYTSTGTFTAAYGTKGTGNKQFEDPSDIAISGSDIYVADSGNRRIQELTTGGEYVSQFGTQGDSGGQFDYPEAIATDGSGHLYIADYANERIEELTTSGQFLTSFGTHGTGEGQLNGPHGIAINAAGNAYIADTENNRVDVWDNSNQSVHDAKTVYYTPEGEAEISECRNHSEWANLPCQTMPVAQPTNTTASSIPTITQVYNALDEVTTTTEAFPANEHFTATTRTKTETFDAAGRALTSEETATVGASLPKTTNKYNSETGALEEQSTPTKTIISVDNTLGQLTSYTDADANTTKYAYDLNGRPEEVSDPKGKQTYAYSATTGLMTKLVDSGAGTFTATYDAEGKMLTDVLPDGLTAKYTYNAIGIATALEYEKKAHCEKTCPETWFSDTVTPSIHGETITQTSSLSAETYSYDSAGRLTETQEITASKTCKARLYAYDEEGNRLSETNREASTETCPAEGGTTERHIYDPANRLIDTGVVYDALGDETELPAGDAGGYKLTSTFYADSQVATQNQREETIEYNYDPSGRTRETTAKGIKTITHYAAPGEALTWTSESGEKWSRNIPGIDGALDAIQSSTGTTTLQIHDLQGNIVGQVGTSETETKLLASFNNTEFGVPSGGKTPAKYAWLGAGGVSTAFETGITSEGGASYVPQLGRRIQTASVIPPGAFPNGSGPGTPEETVVPGWITAINEQESTATLAEWAAIQEAERKALEGEDPECKIKIAVGHFEEKKKELVYARGWASCGGKFLPKYSELEVCLIDEFTPQEGAEVPPLAVCDLAGSGYNPNNGKDAPLEKQLYAHWHLNCESEKAYWGWVWFWVPGMKKGVEKYTNEPWECGEAAEVDWFEIAVTFYEVFPSVGADT